MSEPSFIEGVDVDSFQSFEDGGYSDEDALKLAQAHLEEAIPCLHSKYSSLTEAQKLSAKFAVLEMARYIQNTHEDFDRVTSPFQSETLGAYSYNKMAQAIRSQDKTGVPAFDSAVSLLSGLCAEDVDSGTGSSSEQVFKPGYEDYRKHREWGSQRTYPHQWNRFWGDR